MKISFSYAWGPGKVRDPSKERYWLWLHEKQAGPFSLRQIAQMAEAEPPSEDCPEGDPAEIDRETLFWSETLKEWQPLKYMGEEWDRMDNRDRLQDMISTGAQWAEYLSAGNGMACAFCIAMDRKIVPRSEMLRLPLDGCTCTPWPTSEWLARHHPK